MKSLKLLLVIILILTTLALKGENAAGKDNII
jgi:hypothetical protein